MSPSPSRSTVTAWVGAVLLSAASTLFCTPAAALDLNGFLPPAGGGAVAVSQTSESYDHFWRGETKVPNPGFLGEVTTDSTSLWFTWGFTDDLALVADVAYVDADSDGTNGFADSGLQNVEALLEYRIASFPAGHGRHNLIVAAGGRTPISDYVGDAPVSLGDDSTDALFRFVYQYHGGPFYFSQQVGYDLRGKDVPDGFPLFTEIGYTFGRVTLSGLFSNYIADGGTDIGDPGFTFPGNQEEYQRLGAKVYGRLTPSFGLFVQYFTALDGRNSGDVTGISFGGAYSF